MRLMKTAAEVQLTRFCRFQLKGSKGRGETPQVAINLILVANHILYVKLDHTYRLSCRRARVLKIHPSGIIYHARLGYELSTPPPRPMPIEGKQPAISVYVADN